MGLEVCTGNKHHDISDKFAVKGHRSKVRNVKISIFHVVSEKVKVTKVKVIKSRESRSRVILGIKFKVKGSWSKLFMASQDDSSLNPASQKINK